MVLISDDVKYQDNYRDMEQAWNSVYYNYRYFALFHALELKIASGHGECSFSSKRERRKEKGEWYLHGTEELERIVGGFAAERAT